MIWDSLLFLAAGMVGGAVNVAAGGAKLFVFPMLLSAGLPPVAANATGTVGLWPAQVPGVVVYRKSFAGGYAGLALDAGIACCGAVLGALALIVFGEGLFLKLVPFCLALAVGAILFGDRLKALAGRLADDRRGPWLSRVLFFFCGCYAGYFGAGLGFMVLASILVSGAAKLHAANARKNLISVAANTAAVLPISLSGLVHWQAAVCVLLGGLIGGYGGARLIRLVPERPLKIAIAVMGTVLTLSFLFGR